MNRISHCYQRIIKKDENFLTSYYTPIPSGSTPLKRLLVKHLKYRIINLDNSSYINRILKVKRTGNSTTLDSKVTGVLFGCLNRVTRLFKAQQSAVKEMCRNNKIT